MIRHERSSRNTNPRKTDISALFTPIPLTFDDLRREWHNIRAQESAAGSAAMKEYFAMRRMEILKQFPAHELPTILDKLNAPLEDAEEALYAKAN